MISDPYRYLREFAYVVVVVVARLTLQKKPVKPVKSQIRPQLTEEKQRFIHLKIRKRVFFYRIF